MWPTFWKPLVIVIPSAAIVLAVLYMTYHFIDPIPPRHFVIAAGMAGSGYDNFARQYAGILARDGVELEVRNAAGAVEDLNLLRDGAFGVQAALTALGFTRTGDEDTLYSLGGVFDAPIFIFYRHAENSSTRTYFPGPDSHRCGGRFYSALRSRLRRSNRCINRRRNRCGDLCQSVGYQLLAARARRSRTSINERCAS